MGVEVAVEGLTKSFGSQKIWEDVTFDLPAGEVSVLLGPSGTGKSVFLKSLIGLLRPEKGSIVIDGTNILECSAKELYEIRTLFGVLFQDGALFGSMNIYDNTAFPLREHTKKSETEIRQIVNEKMDVVGLSGTQQKLPSEISGGMRKRAGLARALVLEPEIILCDEPDSGLDPVRTALLAQLLTDINTRTDATILVVTHNINLARTLPDNLGMLFLRNLVMFGPREVLLSVVHSRYLNVVANPAVRSALFFVSLIVFYYTPFFELALRTHTGHILMNIHFLVSGYLFAWALIGIDPGPKKWSAPLRLLVLLITITFHAFFGVAMMTGDTLLAPGFFEQLGFVGRVEGHLGAAQTADGGLDTGQRGAQVVRHRRQQGGAGPIVAFESLGRLRKALQTAPIEHGRGMCGVGTEQPLPVGRHRWADQHQVVVVVDPLDRAGCAGDRVGREFSRRSN